MIIDHCPNLRRSNAKHGVFRVLSVAGTGPSQKRNFFPLFLSVSQFEAPIGVL